MIYRASNLIKYSKTSCIGMASLKMLVEKQMQKELLIVI